MQLSEDYVRAIKPTNSRQEIYDGSNTGLVLMVQPSGTKSYVWRGRVRGKIRKQVLGRPDTMKVTKARAKASAITLALADGQNPFAEFAEAKPKPVLTVHKVWEAYMRAEGGTRKSAAEKRRLWERDVQPIIGDEDIHAITPQTLAKMFHEWADTPAKANRIHADVNRFFTWASSSKGWHASRDLSLNPMANVEPPAEKGQPRTRVLKKDELRWLVQACTELGDAKRYESEIAPQMQQWAIAIHVLLRTGQRKSDIVDLSIDEIDGDTATIPASRYKTGKDHAVYLAPQVLALIEQAKDGRRSKVFRCGGNVTKHMDRIRKRVRELAKKEGKSVPHFTIHDLRRTVDTTLRDAWDDVRDDRVADRDVIEAILGHKIVGTEKHYNHAKMLVLKKRAMVWWNNYLDGLGKTT